MSTIMKDTNVYKGYVTGWEILRVPRNMQMHSYENDLQHVPATTSCCLQALPTK
jgi:hypothetical protein